MELDKNRSEARLLAIEELGIDNDDEETVVPLAISFDGTWAKRGFTSNHGMGLCFLLLLEKFLTMQSRLTFVRNVSKVNAG